MPLQPHGLSKEEIQRTEEREESKREREGSEKET